MKKNSNSNYNIYNGKNINQDEYIKFLNDDKVKLIFSIGPAGTGKTLLACQKAINELKNNNIERIIITRPLIGSDDDIGFLPGKLEKKMEPWTKPIFDVFREFYSIKDIQEMIKEEKIEICPLLFMRGRTFKNCFIIADEMQNSNPIQMRMLLTRIGLGSKLVITGDLEQTDINGFNGLEDFLNKFDKFKKFNKINMSNYNQSLIDQIENIKIINFSNKDVERSDIVKNILLIYNQNIIDNLNSINNLNSTNNFTLKKNLTLSQKFNIDDRTNSDAALIPYKDFNLVNNNKRF
jgi:phosphate starvation-inducible PhoH-like protein